MLRPGSLKKTAKEDLFKPGLPDDKKEEGDREDLARRHRSERLSLGEKEPEEAARAEGEQKGRVFIERGESIKAGGLYELTHDIGKTLGGSLDERARME